MTDLAALDRAVEEAERQIRPSLISWDMTPMGGSASRERATADAADLLRDLESAITARAVAQEQARRAKLVEALDKAGEAIEHAWHHLAQDADQSAFDILCEARAALAADRREGR